jgi:hypothetical protein
LGNKWGNKSNGRAEGDKMFPQKLSEPCVSSAMPRDKAFKLFDGGGLYLLVTPKGGRYWRTKYRFAGKENTLSLGVHPEVSLEAARDKHEAARRLLAQGLDPAVVKRQENQEARDAILRGKSEAKAAARGSRIKVTAFPEGGLEICKGKQVLVLSREEAICVNKLLALLLSEDTAHDRKTD